MICFHHYDNTAMAMMTMMHTIALTMAMMIYCMNQNVAYVLSSLLAVLVTILNSITFYSAGTYIALTSWSCPSQVAALGGEGSLAAKQT